MAKRNEYFPESHPHPGSTLKEKLVEMGMGPKEFAVKTDKPEKTINDVLKGKSSITADMAIQFENVTKIPAHFWLNSQRNYDEIVARQKRHESLSDDNEWIKSFPYAAMVKLGWVEKKVKAVEKAEELLNYFGMASFQSWQKYYVNGDLKASFRISLASSTQPFALSAWLRKGELQSENINASVYTAKKFKNILPEIKTIMAKHPESFYTDLQSVCASAGVKLVHTPGLPKAPIHGCTRWLNDTPLIQLAGRYKRNDNFWFTFFHEAGHILLHGKKDIFLESTTYTGSDLEKEKEADDFATRWVFSEEEEKEVIDSAPLSEEDIIAFAKKFNTHPAIIIGRLQFRKLVKYSEGRRFFEAISL